MGGWGRDVAILEVSLYGTNVNDFILPHLKMIVLKPEGFEALQASELQRQRAKLVHPKVDLFKGALCARMCGSSRYTVEGKGEKG